MRRRRQVVRWVRFRTEVRDLAQRTLREVGDRAAGEEQLAAAGGRYEAPPMYGMDNQWSIAVRIVLLCTSLPPPSV